MLEIDRMRIRFNGDRQQLIRVLHGILNHHELDHPLKDNQARSLRRQQPTTDYRFPPMMPSLRPCAESSINTASLRKRVSSFFAVITHALAVR